MGSELKELLNGVETIRHSGEPGIDVTRLAWDSREVARGDLFIALRGVNSDGHAFVRSALEAGAVGAVLGEAAVFDDLLRHGIRQSLVQVRDTRAAMATIAANLYDHPSEHLKVVGITGTNGKTTTSYLIERIFEQAKLHPGVLGTVNYRFGTHTWPASHTTPESPRIQELLAKMLGQGARSAILEVSSHALLQKRVARVAFDAVLFTNLTQDHLDYHASMEEYFAAKRLLFTECLEDQPGKPNPVCVINADDPWGARLVAECRDAGRQVLAYGLHPSARHEQGEIACDIYPLECRWSVGGIKANVRSPWGSFEIHSPLMGEHNVYNALAALAVSRALGVSEQEVAVGLSALNCVPGRLEPVPSTEGVTVLVDYAHTPEALRNVLSAARALTKGRLYCVFGCGGDRDRGKRPLMAKAVADLADVAVLTSDNPRTEDPRQILADAEAGLSGTKGQDYVVEIDRAAAIRLAIAKAGQGDLVLIAGKGHETYQIVGTEKRHFDDREVAAAALAEKGGAQ